MRRGLSGLVAVLSEIVAASSLGAQRPPDTLRGPELRRDTTTRWAEPVETINDRFASIADRVPGFAGVFIERDSVVLMLVDPSRRDDAERAVREAFRQRDFRHFAVRRVEYDARQLRDWMRLAASVQTPELTSLSVEVKRNRILLGVRDSTYTNPARRALAAAGIPPGAILIEIIRSAIRLETDGPVTARTQPRFEPVQPELFSLGGSFTNAWADYDADGDLDLFVGFNGTPNRLYRNDGGVFTDVAGAIGVADARATRAAAWGDYDTDGDPDLLAGFAPGTTSVLRLYRNDRGRFADVTTQVGLARDSGAVRQPAWVDVDGDGDLDLFVAFRDRANAFYRNDGGRFHDIASEIGLADPRRTVGAVWLDYDEDGDLDLYVGNMDGESNGLFVNDGGRFRDVAVEAGLAWAGRLPSDAANGTVRPCAADVDGDGRLDLFAANYGRNGLFLNRGRGRFEDASSAWGIDIDARYDACAFADFDNDGRFDLYVNGTVTGGVSYRDYLFRNTGSRLEDVTMDDLRALHADHGVQWADFDRDGDVDLALTGARADGMHSLLRNMLPSSSASRSLHIRVLDAAGRATRAGSEVRLFAAGTRRLLGTRLVDSGSGYDAQSDMPVHFGFATLQPVDVEVIWPSRGKRTVTRVRRVDPREWSGRVLMVRTRE
jgi:FG-GAP-like repeat/ASPIC and UnbV